jgi:hypothetical protein
MTPPTAANIHQLHAGIPSSYPHPVTQLTIRATSTPTIAILKNPATVMRHPIANRGGWVSKSQ